MITALDNEKFRSKEEIYFSWWLDELIKEGVINSYKYEPHSFLLIEEHGYNWIDNTKKKPKEKSSTLLNSHSYTPDFLISWNGFHKKLMWDLYHPDMSLTTKINKGKIVSQKNRSWIDVKGSYNKHGGDRIFPIHQKMMFEKKKLYINKIEPKKLFSRTFTPKKYIVTDGGGQLRKIDDWEPIPVKEFLTT